MVALRLIYTLLSLSLLLVMSPAFADPIDDAFQAFFSGNYKEAHRIVEPLATRGHPFAQALLGILYEEGNGVPKSELKARQLYDSAADAGNCVAMVHLGRIYAEGRSEAQDFVAAYMWSNLAVQYGCAGGAVVRDNVAKKMTSEDVSEAQKRTREWNLAVSRRR